MPAQVEQETNICGLIFKRINENQFEIHSDGVLQKTVNQKTTPENFNLIANQYFVYNW